MMKQVMLALSIQQPWAWLIVNGFKDIENRTWSTKYRGTFWVHAGKRIDDEAVFMLKKNFDFPAKFETGGIVGTMRIVDCVTASPSKWFMGPYGFVIKEAKPSEFSPCRGALGFFNPISGF